MKKFLLFICLLPGLAFAQSVSNKAAKFQRFLQKSAPIETRASVFATATLDSTYWFQGAEELLTNRTYFTYNDAGQVVRKMFSSGDGFVVSGKAEYSYAGTAENKSEEEINYHLENGQWIPGYKTVTKYNHTQTPIAMYQYYYEEGVWVDDNFQVSTEFNADGYPTVLMDSAFHKEEPVTVMRMEIAYDKKHNAEGLNILEPGRTNGEWILSQKAKLTYDEAGRTLSQYHEVKDDEGNWEFSFYYTYEYDERGNMIREIDKDAEFVNPYPMRYQNFYSDHVVTKNESIQVNNTIRMAVDAGSQSLSVDLGEEQRATVTIISAAGAVVRRISLNESLSTISLNELNGYYIVHIQTLGGVKSQSVIIR